MKILALDSSQNLQSFAVYDTELEKFILGEAFPGKSSEIIEKLKNSFLDNKLKLKDIDLLAVNLGPGSFTGIRNALCIIKTLALELGLKVFTTNSFELLRLEKGLTTWDDVEVAFWFTDKFDELEDQLMGAYEAKYGMIPFCNNTEESLFQVWDI